MTTPNEFRALIDSPESMRIEFKAASGGFHFDKLTNCSTSMNRPMPVHGLENYSRSYLASAVNK